MVGLLLLPDSQMGDVPNPEEPRLDPALAALTAGSRVGVGRFTLLRLLGRGGMGVVWLARDEQLREGVALKFVPPEIRHDAAALDDLRRETCRSRKLTHPHIIRIHDFYQVDDEAFISMEYVDGPNLSELRLQQRDRVLKWSFLEPLVRELCDALQYAHGEHIVHRDLKPANMMLDSRGRLKLADFGIAAVVTDSISRRSVNRHGLSGTASYMSPQQLDGHMPEVTDDVYSVGATLYELLASRAPFFTGDIPHQVRSFAPPPLEKRLAQLDLHNGVPPTVSAMIMACLAKDPAQRPQSARAIAEQLGLEPLNVTPKTAAMPVAKPAPTGSAQEKPAQRPASVPWPVSQTASDVGSVLTSSRETPMYPRPRATRSESPQPASDPPFSERRAGILPASRRMAVIALFIVVVALVAGISWWARQHYGGNSSQNTKPSAPPAPEFVSLFNGHDFAGWDGDPQVWSVKDGVITATNATSKEHRPVALFWRGGTVEDFELRLSFRLKAGNSGIYYRAKQLLGYEVGGYQFEIIGNQTGTLLETGPDRMRREPSRRGAVTRAQVVNGREKVTVQSTNANVSELKAAFRPRDWNDVLIVVQSNRIIHKLNGTTVIDTTDEYEKRPRTGTVAFEVYGSAPTSIQFRDVRLKRLRAGSSGP